MRPSTFISAGPVVEAMAAEEGARFGSAYGDLLEVCRHMEIRQDICREVIVKALLATVETLKGLPQVSIDATGRATRT